jgi:plastocyanin
MRMRSTMKFWPGAGAGLVAVAALLSAACGGGSSEKTPTTAPTTAATATRPAATAAATKPAVTPTQPAATTTPVATVAATQSAEAPTAAATDATAGTTLTLSEKNNLFDKSALKAAPGDVTFVINNQDNGIPHNFHLHKGNDAAGQDVGNTQIEVGPGTQTLKLNLVAGSYYYNCDVHPATAFGKLEVK